VRVSRDDADELLGGHLTPFSNPDLSSWKSNRSGRCTSLVAETLGLLSRRNLVAETSAKEPPLEPLIGIVRGRCTEIASRPSCVRPR
jgi:hypothetical protein